MCSRYLLLGANIFTHLHFSLVFSGTTTYSYTKSSLALQSTITSIRVPTILTSVHIAITFGKITQVLKVKLTSVPIWPMSITGRQCVPISMLFNDWINFIKCRFSYLLNT